jgi:hypothetical protein
MNNKSSCLYNTLGQYNMGYNIQPPTPAGAPSLAQVNVIPVFGMSGYDQIKSGVGGHLTLEDAYLGFGNRCNWFTQNLCRK